MTFVIIRVWMGLSEKHQLACQLLKKIILPPLRDTAVSFLSQSRSRLTAIQVFSCMIWVSDFEALFSSVPICATLTSVNISNSMRKTTHDVSDYRAKRFCKVRKILKIHCTSCSVPALHLNQCLQLFQLFSVVKSETLWERSGYPRNKMQQTDYRLFTTIQVLAVRLGLWVDHVMFSVETLNIKNLCMSIKLYEWWYSMKNEKPAETLFKLYRTTWLTHLVQKCHSLI